MKNETITLDTIVPKEIRKQVYQEALKYYQNYLIYPNKYQNLDDEDSLGLCLLLPCVLWDLEHYLNDSPTGLWEYEATVHAFPEIKDYIPEIQGEFNQDKKLKIRIKVLTEILYNLNYTV